MNDVTSIRRLRSASQSVDTSPKRQRVHRSPLRIAERGYKPEAPASASLARAWPLAGIESRVGGDALAGASGWYSERRCVRPTTGVSVTSFVGHTRRRSIACSNDSAAIALLPSRRPTALRPMTSCLPRMCKPPSSCDASIPPAGLNSSECSCSKRTPSGRCRRPASSGAGSCGPTWLRLRRGEGPGPNRNGRPYPITPGKWTQTNISN